MNEVTWAAVVGVFLVITQVINMYNSFKTASKNAKEPMETLRQTVNQNSKDISEMKHTIFDIKKDVDHAHAKIRETDTKLERSTKAQSKALLALLFWAKSGGTDSSKIDDAIDEISEL
jgi:septal ring factor EnvC (AmiA/AmiB activator)